MKRIWSTKLVSVVACLWVVGAPVWADSHSSPSRQIQVSGEARISAQPDMATLTLGVTSFDPEAARAMAQTSQKMVAVIDKLIAFGILGEDMQTSQLTLTPRWEQDRAYDNQSGRKLVGFEAANMLTVRVVDINTVGPLLDQMLKVGANHFRGLRFGLQDTSAVEEALRVAAVQDAIAKAKVLTDAAGVDLGPVRSISDHGNDHGVPMMAMEAARSDFSAIAPGSLEFNHSVSVVFDLEVAE